MAILVLESVAQGQYKHLVELEKTLEKKFHIDLGGAENLNSENLASTIDRRRIKPETFNQKFNKSDRNKIIEIIKSGLNIRKLSRDDANLMISYLQTRPGVTLYLKDDHSEHEFEDLSSGERNLISLGLKIISRASRHTLILIDEPEISLHLQWQMEFHKNLIKMLAAYRNYHVVIATHSPILVSEAARNSRSDTIFVLKGAHEKTNSSSIDRSFKIIEADDIRSCDDLTLMHFHTPTYNSKAIDIRIAELVVNATSSEPIENSITELEELRDTDNLQPDKQSVIKQALELIQLRNARRANEKVS
ncbi:AAA family ATPase [Pseudomonas sp. 22-AL-CL-001]|uniref:AAA family ATPase n=1 Tax=Pseudomonas alabamensis TaxID=3064349 RepID=UPI0027142EE2|nr:AAA family ATPase [Pseudomonas sp. 22-AL-CL-001]MDO7908956.1 AAA family ATPase [Pseudomonas sp. 22-AL-CL-001]